MSYDPARAPGSRGPLAPGDAAPGSCIDLHVQAADGEPMENNVTIGGRWRARWGGVAFVGLGLTVGALLACGPGEDEPEEEPCVERFATTGDEEYEALDPETAAAQLEGVWASTNVATTTPQVHVALVAGEPPDQIGACAGRWYTDLPMEAYVWTSDGSLDTALGGELRIEQTGDDRDSRVVLTGSIESAIPASDLAGPWLEQVVESGFPLRLSVVLDDQTGAPTTVTVLKYEDYYTPLLQWTSLYAVE